jgi:hypothetical protein
MKPATDRNYTYCNNTTVVLDSMMHTAILAGIANNGVLCEELADLIRLHLAPVKNPNGSDRWVVDWA